MLFSLLQINLFLLKPVDFGPVSECTLTEVLSAEGTEITMGGGMNMFEQVGEPLRLDH